MRHFAIPVLAMSLLAAPAFGQAVAASPDVDGSWTGTWQVTEIISSEDPALKRDFQPGRLMQLGRQSVRALNGDGCANPTLGKLSDLRMRGIDPLLLRLENVEGAYKEGLAATCLGTLFAVYVLQPDGSLLAADRAALYRLQPLAGSTSP